MKKWLIFIIVSLYFSQNTFAGVDDQAVHQVEKARDNIRRTFVVDKWDQLRHRADAIIAKSKSCQKDADCIISEEFGSLFGSYVTFNKNANLDELKEIQTKIIAAHKVYIYEASLVPARAMCENNKCVLHYESSTNTQTQDILLTIKPDKNEYALDEEINMEVTFKNISTEKKKILLYEEPQKGYLVFSYLTLELSGRFDHADYKVTFPIDQPSATNKPVWVDKSLEPSQSTSFTIPLKKKVDDWGVAFIDGIVKKIRFSPGTYDLQISYKAPPVPSGSFWNGDVISNKIQIKILQPKEKDGCQIANDCSFINCGSYNTGYKDGFKPDCVDKVCKCMCYGCE